MWAEDTSGALQPELSLFPFSTADLRVDVEVMLPGGVVGWSEGPFAPLSDMPLSLPIEMPSEIGSTLAAVRVLVTATHPDSGQPLGHRSAWAYAYRRESTVHLVRKADAAALAIMPAPYGDALAGEVLVEDGFIGREVTP